METFVKAFLLSMFKEVLHCFSHRFVFLVRRRNELQWKVIVGVFGYVALNKRLAHQVVAIAAIRDI